MAGGANVTRFASSAKQSKRDIQVPLHDISHKFRLPLLPGPPSFWSLSQSISLLKIKQIDFKMQSVLGGAVEKAGEAVSGAIGSNKKITDMKQNTIDPTKNDFLTSDFGVKQNSHDNWLHASTGDRQGPALLEDNHGREKVCLLRS